MEFIGRRQIARKFGVSDMVLKYLEKIKKIFPKKINIGGQDFMKYDKKDIEFLKGWTSND